MRALTVPVLLLCLLPSALLASDAAAQEAPAAAPDVPTADPGADPAEKPAAESFADPVTAAFAGYAPLSSIELDHGWWGRFLSKTVVYAGASTQRLNRGEKRRWVGSRIGYGNDLPSRYENNRVVLSGFAETHLAALRRYRRGLETLPDRLPLAALNRAEQLAYWLNLYNAHALEHVAGHYPAETTEALRGPPGSPASGVWHERTLTVAGVDLSLVDIERKILFPIWDDPLVLYGLWQGAIGGPRLPLRPYTGARVWDMLAANAREFVNSNRGMKPEGAVLEVSLLYGWGAPLFEDEAALHRHIAALADPPFSMGLEATDRLEHALYDWHLADLSGGTHHRGQWNNIAAFVAGMSNDHRSQQLANLAISRDTTRNALPAATVELLQSMERFNDRAREGRVTVEECPRGGCDAAAPGDDDTDEEGNTAADADDAGGKP